MKNCWNYFVETNTGFYYQFKNRDNIVDTRCTDIWELCSDSIYSYNIVGVLDRKKNIIVILKTFIESQTIFA